MAAISGRWASEDPKAAARYLLAQIQAELAVDAAFPESVVPLRYVFQSGYWCVVKNGSWPNLTGWAEHRELQRIFAPKLAQLKADGVPHDEAWRRASDDAQQEMLVRTTTRKNRGGGL